MATELPIQPDGDDSFALGSDSYTNPTKLGPGEYVTGMNVICRGGIAQTRPGSRSLFTMPSGNLQGITLFTPTSGAVSMVFAVNGIIYASSYPFEEYHKIDNIKFDPNSKFIAWANCLQSTYYDSAGVLTFLQNPRSVLIMQDGSTRAAYWNGSESGHLNPTPSGSETTIEGYDETPVGLWMYWSNNRLWVSRGGQIFASDIGNPLKFADSQFLNEGRAFYLSADCTGIVETSDQQGIICFTANSGVFIRSSILDRTQWLSTPGFQQTILPYIGCVAPRSIVYQYGLIWWYSSRGLINQNDALKLNITSRFDVQDNEMAASKAYLNYDLSGVCGATNENFLFHAVPFGSNINTRLHVLDQAPFEGNQNAWPSFWTGWRPVEFARGIIATKERVFCASYDYDGVNRVWELFRNEKDDNGIPITCYVQTRPHFFQNRDYKQFKYCEIEMCNITGPVALRVGAAGLRGAYQSILMKDINATIGQVYPESLYSNAGNLFAGNRMQTRIVRSQDGYSPSECNIECVESDQSGLIDKAFSLAICWSGVAGISAYRLFSIYYPQALQGECESNETGETRLINENGCASIELFSTTNAFDTYYASSTTTWVNGGQTASHTSIQASNISQQDANRKASATSKWYVYSELGLDI